MFSAECTPGKYKSQYLSFHSFLVNIGNDFDLSSGTFTTPITGIYELTFFGSMPQNGRVEIEKNNEKVAKYYQSYGVSFVGPTFLLPFHKGDKIRIYYGNAYSGSSFKLMCI